jgi:hypothetical protein
VLTDLPFTDKNWSSKSTHNMTGFCRNLLDYGSVRIFTREKIGGVMIALGALYFIMSLLIIYFIKRQEWKAQQGDDQAVKSVVFPIFVQVLWINAAINIYIAFIALAFDFSPYVTTTNQGAIWAFSLMWSLQHCLVEGVAILLMQKGLGRNAAVKAIRLICFWGIFAFMVHWTEYNAPGVPSLLLDIVWNLSILAIYGSLWFTPMKNLYRRPAAIFYGKFWFLFRCCLILISIAFFIPYTKPGSDCLYVFGGLYSFALLEPFVLYYTFLQDSRWWQGIDITSSTGKDELELKSPLLGMDLNVNSAQSLAASMDNMGISPHFHPSFQQKNVKLLNFAYLSLNTNKILGTGSFSRVYLGKYRQKPVAIKLIYTMDVTKEIIARIAAEAEILSSLKCPNVVEILGVSVLPPSVCIILELCTYGSLNDVINGTGFADIGEVTDTDSFMKQFLRGGGGGAAENHININNDGSVSSSSKHGLMISWMDRLFLAIGCAKGIAAVHSLRSDICHRDIKSFNFLVDDQLNAKISDLELGTTYQNVHSGSIKSPASPVKRIIPSHFKKSFNLSGKSSRQKQQKSTSQKDNYDNAINDLESPRPSEMSDFDSSILQPLVGNTDKNTASNTNSNSARSLLRFTTREGLHGSDFLANWSAPEVIKHALHSQASDIYSFGLVLWEIIMGIPPFHEIANQDIIRKNVLNDIRPNIPSIFLNPPYDRVFSSYIDLIQRCWHKEPLLRPSITVVVERLENLYKKHCLDIINETEFIDQIILQSSQQQQQQQSQQHQQQHGQNENQNNPQQLQPQSRIGATNSGASSNNSKQSSHSLMKSLFPQQKPSFYQNINANQMKKVIHALEEQQILNKFIATEETWCLCFPVAENDLKILWVSPSFEETFNQSLKDIQGKQLSTLPCFDTRRTSPQRKETIQHFFSDGVKEMKFYHQDSRHFLLELLTGRWRVYSNNSVKSSRSNIGVGGGSFSSSSSSSSALSLFSLHCFPIPNSNRQQTTSRNSADMTNMNSRSQPIMIGSSSVSSNPNQQYQLNNPNSLVAASPALSAMGAVMVPPSPAPVPPPSSWVNSRDSLESTASSVGRNSVTDTTTSTTTGTSNNNNISNYSNRGSVGLVAILFTHLKDY